MPPIIRKNLREPNASVSTIQQLGGITILTSYFAKDILVLRILALGGILFFNMIPNYCKRNYVNVGWGALFAGLNSYRLAELLVERKN